MALKKLSLFLTIVMLLISGMKIRIKKLIKLQVWHVFLPNY